MQHAISRKHAPLRQVRVADPIAYAATTQVKFYLLGPQSLLSSATVILSKELSNVITWAVNNTDLDQEQVEEVSELLVSAKITRFRRFAHVTRPVSEFGFFRYLKFLFEVFCGKIQKEMIEKTRCKKQH